jgi:LysM repeat protein
MAQVPMSREAQQKFVHHIEPFGLVLIESIQPGMTLYRLSKKYNVGIDSILSVNPDLDPHSIPLGFPVNIPIFRDAISLQVPADVNEGIPVFYRVQPKETLYRISKVYLGIEPDSLLTLNPRASQSLSIGQVLHIGWYDPEENTQHPALTATSPASDSTLYRVTDYSKEYKTEGLIIREQKGLAVWKPGNEKTHYFVLHSTARVGSYMEITNPMLHRTLTAKVSGNIPPGLYQSHVGLVVSPSVARALGVLDHQFFASWRFVE